MINGTPASQLLVDWGSPVTIIRADFWRQIRDPTAFVENEPEDFEGVTRDGLHIIGITRLALKIGKLQVAHPVLIAESIAHKFILGNDFLIQHKCDNMNSQCAILFKKESVLYMLLRSTVNCECPVVCSVTTTIGPNEEAVIPALLDASTKYTPGDSILLEPRQETFAGPLLGARVLVSYSSAVVPVLITNLSNQSVTIAKDKVLCHDDRATPLLNTCANKLSPNCLQA